MFIDVKISDKASGRKFGNGMNIRNDVSHLPLFSI